MLLRAICIICYFFMFCAALSAQQNPQLHFVNLGTQDGLPSPEVHCMLEDSRGYMWFGTDNGVSRFDGYRFENFGRKEGLGNPVVLEMFEDQRGHIWLGTLSGYVYIYKDGCIVPWSHNSKLQTFSSQVSKASLQHLSADETAYFEFSGYGIVVVDSLGCVTTYRGDITQGRVALETSDGKQVIYTIINRYDRDDYYRVSLTNQLREILNFELIRRLATHDFMLPTYKGLHTFEYATKVSNSVLLFVQNGVHYFDSVHAVVSKPFYHRVTDATQNDEGELWLCLEGAEGVRRYTNVADLMAGGRYRQYLLGESVSSTIEDRQGGRWVATLTNGVFYAQAPQMLTYNQASGFSENYTRTVTFKNDSILYAGLDNNVILEIDDRQYTVTQLPANDLAAESNSLYYDKERSVLYNHLFALKDTVWQYPWENLLEFDTVRPFYSTTNKITSTTSEEIYLSTPAGAAVFHKAINFVDQFTLEVELKRTYDVMIDHSKRRWIGTNDGLQQFTDCYLPPPRADSAFHTRVEAIEQLSDSTIVFGTKGLGITFWKEEQLVNLTTADGLTADMIENIYVDEHDVVWVGTLAGLNKVTRRSDGSFQIRQYQVNTGLPSNEIHEVKSYNGQLWICTSAGLVKFHEHEEETSVTSPVLTSVQVNNQTHPLSAAPNFSYDQKNIDFHWLRINFRQRGRVPYRYRLNAEEDWTYTQNLTVKYPALAPGVYTFEVQAQNEDRYWSPSTQFVFKIRLPWWETGWFRGAILILVGCGVYYLYHRRLQHIVKETKTQRQLLDLERSALQAQMNPHFIFNCLNSIQHFILKNEKQKAVEYLSRFARLVRHNLNASVQGEIELAEEVDLLNNYLALERERFGQAFDYRIEVADALADQLILIPPLLIQPYVENAVIHGLSGKHSNGKVSVVFSECEGYLVVKVSDNGKGYRIGNHKKTTTRHKSVGMSVTSARLRLLSGKDSTGTNTCTISSSEGNGTEVVIKLKIERYEPTTQRRDH